MKKNIANIQASIRGRLQDKAKETGRPFSEVLQYYGMERFLYRFSRSAYADKFILKGALMFMVWVIVSKSPVFNFSDRPSSCIRLNCLRS